jgi:hypothetical protein
MHVRIKSITPRIVGEFGRYQFVLEIEASTGGESRTLPPMLAETVLDYQRCRAAVAKHTGWLLTSGEGRDEIIDWESILRKAWQEPESLEALQKELEAERKRRSG